MDAANCSVIICAYTDERWGDLNAAIASVEGQTTPPGEVIVVVDHNPTLLARVRAEIPAVSAVANGRDRGLGGARNSGVAAAIGAIIVFLDDDALAAPDWLARLVAATTTRASSASVAKPSRPGSGGDRTGSPPSSTGSSAAPTGGCPRARRRCGTSTAAICPTGANSSTSSAGSPSATAATRPSSVSAPCKPAPPGCCSINRRRVCSTASRPAAGAGAISARAASSRGARRRWSPGSSAARTASPPSVPTRCGPCRSAWYAAWPTPASGATWPGPGGGDRRRAGDHHGGLFLRQVRGGRGGARTGLVGGGGAVGLAECQCSDSVAWTGRGDAGDQATGGLPRSRRGH